LPRTTGMCTTLTVLYFFWTHEINCSVKKEYNGGLYRVLWGCENRGNITRATLYFVYCDIAEVRHNMITA
jgi:hypothetical protein